MKVFVTGVNGQLGHDVVNELCTRRFYPISSDLSPYYLGIEDGSFVCNSEYIPLDITNRREVEEVIEDIKPDAVIHCAAWTHVESAEYPENKNKVFLVNSDGPRNIAEACKKIGAKMVYISTDYVFSGKGNNPWRPDNKSFAPLNVYGNSKLEGEKKVSSILDNYFIVRTSWVFGKNGKNFIKTMLNLAEKHDTLPVVDDQIGTPTYTYDLSRLLVDMIETDKYGYYHATNEGGYISWADFAKAIFEETRMSTKVIPVATSKYGGTSVKRPFNSRLDKSKLIENGFKPLPLWQDALHRYLVELGVIR